MARCGACGADLVLVGKMHRCVPAGWVKGIAPPLANTPKLVANSVANDKPQMANTRQRYRDGHFADKRRTYMRAHMAKKRSTKQ